MNSKIAAASASVSAGSINKPFWRCCTISGMSPTFVAMTGRPLAKASPIVLREAFASGRPVIATKVGDIPEIVQHRQNGLLIEPADTEALAAAILEFIADPELAAHCAANGLCYATEHFSFDKMMQAKLRADFVVLR